MKARLLKSRVLEQLRLDVPKNLEIYRSGQFGDLLQDPALFIETSPELDVGALTQLVPEDGVEAEAKNCTLFFRAFTNITPYIARDERLWAYMTHTSLLDYSRKRWPIPSDTEAAVKHIQLHFFARDKRAIDRDNAASRLWWMAYLCSRVPAFQLEESLEILLFRADVRANIIERPSISQNSIIFSKIIEALHKSYSGDRDLFERTLFRPLMMKVNSIGGFRLLDYMPEAQVTALVDDLVNATFSEAKTAESRASTAAKQKGQREARSRNAGGARSASTEQRPGR